MTLPQFSGPKTAMVLAAGLGTRMRPLTDDRPKALIEVGDRALIDHVLDRLVAVGVETAVVNVHWFAERLEQHLAQRNDIRIVISDEREALLETGGGLKKAKPLLGDGPVFVANIDSVWIDRGDALNDLIALWNEQGGEQKMDAALLLARREGAIGFDGAGDFSVADDGQLAFRGDRAEVPFAYMGVHITRPNYADNGPDGAFSLSPLWRASAQAGRLFGTVMDGDWMHVGDPQARDAAEAKLAKQD